MLNPALTITYKHREPTSVATSQQPSLHRALHFLLAHMRAAAGGLPVSWASHLNVGQSVSLHEQSYGKWGQQPLGESMIRTSWILFTKPLIDVKNITNVSQLDYWWICLLLADGNNNPQDPGLADPDRFFERWRVWPCPPTVRLCDIVSSLSHCDFKVTAFPMLILISAAYQHSSI